MNMSAEANRNVADFIALFQEIWAECQALRDKGLIEASGHSADWEECIASAQTQAREIFEPAFSALEKNAPLPRVLKKVRDRLVASRTHAASPDIFQLSRH